MAEIEFTQDEKSIIARKIQLYFQEELRQEIGQFDAEFLLDFFAEETGSFFITVVSMMRRSFWRIACKI